jgi:hypothetical protein
MTLRPVDLIREEIGDLAAYLRNLPLSLRDSPYGQVYQQRLTALTDELAQVELARLAAESRCPAIDLRVNGGRTAVLEEITGGAIGEPRKDEKSA